MLVVDPSQDIADWVAAQYGCAAPSVDAAIGVADEQGLRAGVFFDGMSKNNIFAHIASRADVMPRALLVATAKYVYKQLDLDRMTFVVPEDNEDVLALVLGFGAKYEGRLAKAAGTCDMLWFVLWRDAAFSRRMLKLAEREDGK